MRNRIAQGVLVTAAAAGAGVVVPALAQDRPETRIVSHATATPSKAGTARHPRGIAISASARLIVEADFEPPVVTSIDILVGQGLVWNRDKYDRCSQATLERRGPRGCPRTSLMGTATATGQADTVDARLDVLFYNGGEKRIYAYATLDRPARVREVLVVKSLPVPGPLWGHRESVDIPRTLQIVAGIPLQLTRLKMSLGGKSYAKDYVTSTSCPRGGWKYQVTAHLLFVGLSQNDQNVSTGSMACTT
jgi:hypothetical protein